MYSNPGSRAQLVALGPMYAFPAAVQVLQTRYPGHGILTEEGGTLGEPSSGYLWCIDPLDGTVNFAHSYPCFAVSVGVLHNALPQVGYMGRRPIGRVCTKLDQQGSTRKTGVQQVTNGCQVRSAGLPTESKHNFEQNG